MNESKVSKNKLRTSSSLNEKDKYLIVRDNHASPNPSKFRNSVTIQTLCDTENSFKIFFESHSCYDLVPDSSKLVVFDTSLNVKKAFYALIYNGVRAAILWDSPKQAYLGMFTITDFIKILRNEYMKFGSDFEKLQYLESQNIDSWRTQYKSVDSDFNELASVRPESSLKEALEMLLRKRVHRLPVIDYELGSPLHIITHKRLLKFLYMNLYHLPMPSFMNKSIGQIPVGTFGNVCTVQANQAIIVALSLFLDKRVSALPVINSEGVLVDIYSKFDVINLAATRTYHLLDRTIQDALEYREKKFGEVATCSKNDTFLTVLELFNTHEVHRLVVVDNQKRVEGLISLSDVFEFFVRHHKS